MTFKILEKTLAEEPAFRLKQANQALFVQLISDWDEATVFSKLTRAKLNKEFSLTVPTKIASDGKTQKALLTLADGAKIETVLMCHQNRNTVCVSTQVGCALGCKFCATGSMGFKRNLTEWEIVLQVLIFARQLKEKNQKITNIVFMGMGEPFLNYEAVMDAINPLHRQMDLGARRFSISTAGIPEGIRKLANQPLEINLALSLHAPSEQLRSELMPINRQYPLREVLAAIDEYLKKTHRKVMFEYLMIDQVNDQPKQAQELIRLVGKKLVTINLIPYNPTNQFKPSPQSQIKHFRAQLEKAGLSVTQRFEFGQKIKAACGQLATQN